VRLLIFTIVAAVAFLVAYAFGLGGTVSTIIFLFILFNGALDRVAHPLLEKLRA
jgi:hypothetical protein